MIRFNEQVSIIDQTVITRDRCFFESIYQQSIVAILQQHQSSDLLIWNCSIYDTEIAPLRIQDWCTINIGEIGSVIVSKEFRNQNLWNNLLKRTLEQYESTYTAIIAATINPTFEHIALSQGFYSYHKSKFPKEYFQQGEKYLWTQLQARWTDFEHVARFLIRSNQRSLQQLLSYIQYTNAL